MGNNLIAPDEFARGVMEIAKRNEAKAGLPPGTILKWLWETKNAELARDKKAFEELKDQRLTEDPACCFKFQGKPCLSRPAI